MKFTDVKVKVRLLKTGFIVNDTDANIHEAVVGSIHEVTGRSAFELVESGKAERCE